MLSITDYLAAVNPEYFIQTGDFRIMDNDYRRDPDLSGAARIFPRQNIPAIFRQSLLTFPVPRSLPTWMIPVKFTAAVLPSSLLIMTASRTAWIFHPRRTEILCRQQPSSRMLHFLARTETGIEYTADENGVITNERHVIGWVKRDGKWYYYNDDETPYTGWLTLDHKTYYPRRGLALWQQAGFCFDGDYYYFSGSGGMETGWQFISNNWYYLAKDTGIMYSSGWHADPETKTMYYFLHGEVPPQYGHLP